MREYASPVRPYELMTIFTPDVADDQVLDQLEVVAGYIRTAGGAVFEVLHEAPWGRRRFAYPIRHAGRDVRDGFYSVIRFDLVPDQVTDVERDLKLDERVLRHMLTLNEAPGKRNHRNDGDGQGETITPTDPSERVEIQSGDLVRNAQAAREAAEAAEAARRPAQAPVSAPAQNAPPAAESGTVAQAAQTAPGVDAAPEVETVAAADATPATEPAPVIETAPATEPTPATEAAPATETTEVAGTQPAVETAAESANEEPTGEPTRS